MLFHLESHNETLIYRKSYYEITYDEFMNEDSIASYVEGKLKKTAFWRVWPMGQVISLKINSKFSIQIWSSPFRTIYLNPILQLPFLIVAIKG